MSQMDISVTINGEPVNATIDARTHLADFLREERLLTGTHLGCEQGVCGACTLMVNGNPVRSCLTLAVACDGADVHTVEGFGDDLLMQKIRDSFKRHHGLQCGFCTPGMLSTAYDIIRRIPNADAVRIRQELSGNLCRCSGYAGIVAAIVDVIEDAPPLPSVTPRLKGNRSQTVSSTSKETPPKTPQHLTQTQNENPINLEDLPDGITLSKALTIDAEPDAVWKIVRDLPSVVSCIPGAELTQPFEDNTFTGTYVVTLGPMRATFRGNGAYRLDETEKTGRVAGKGKDSISRSSVEGMLIFELQPINENQCRLLLEMTYRLKGPLAQFGRKGLVNEIADRVLADAAQNMTALATGHTGPLVSAGSVSGLTLLVAVIGGWFKRIFRM